MGLQVGEEANPGAAYFGAVWAGVGSGGRGFGLDLRDFLLSESALDCCSTVEIVVVLCSTILDKLSPGHPVSCCGLPGLWVYVALLDVSFDVVLVSFLLPTWGTLTSGELGV